MFRVPRIGKVAARSAVAGVVAGLLAGTSPVRADEVLDWNEIADNTSVVAGPPPVRARITAMAQIAVHDALNSIHPRYESYTNVPLAPAGASPGAAVAAAAYAVLVQTVPSQAGPLLTAYNSKIAGLGPCPAEYPTCITAGVMAGEAAANAILALRAGDGSAPPDPAYTLPPGPGVYQPTPNHSPPSEVPPQFARWATMLPFVMYTGSQFRAHPSAIFQLNSAAYAHDFDEVKRVGHVDAEANGDRTPDQSEIARFWPAGGANFNAVTRVIVAGRGLDLWEHARLLALVNIAMSDSTVAVFDTKYAYNFWRPVTAIRAAATDGNPATAPDPAWLSYLVTPPYPDYTCGLTTNTGAAFEVLRRFFGRDRIAYTFTAAGATRSYSSLSEAAAEAVDARVFGGMHFRTGCAVGVQQGEQVGRFVFQNALKPLRPSQE
jgi:hypothetical protein